MKSLFNSVSKTLVGFTLALVGFCLPMQAQNFLSQSFLNVRALSSTNGANISNLASFKYPLQMSNNLNIVYTNKSGNGFRVTNASDYATLLVDASLWTDRDGRSINQTFGTHAGVGVSGLAGMASNTLSTATLFVRGRSGSGVNGDVTLVFQPIWDGTNAPISTLDDWSVVFDTTASAYNTLATNVPMWRWPGAQKLRLKSIVNANSAAAGECWFEQISLNGFVP